MPRIFLIIFSSFLFAAEKPQILPPEIVQSRFLKLHSDNNERATDISRLFTEAGCDSTNFREEKVHSSDRPNVICVLPGASKRTIVVGAHFDNRGPGEGAIDNWSGAALLPSLYESLHGPPHRFTFEFIGFTDEERGLIGSRDYANNLSKEHRAEISFYVNIDSVGVKGPIRVWFDRSNDLLLESAFQLASRERIQIASDSLGRYFDSDASAFTAWQVPAIDFNAIPRSAFPLLHSKQDVRKAVDLKSYYDDYRFLANYLAYLDETIDLGPTHR